MNETLDKKNLQENTVNACHKCGTELESVKYCAECKTVIRHLQTGLDEERLCGKCGQVMTNAKYCANCKTVIKQSMQCIKLMQAKIKLDKLLTELTKSCI